ncbi:hypothetical protein OCS_03739 [Ophiocordyceps sinensis CO18]|uniref:Cell wall galactomannoprotein n=1 Tax=Ophiocordyceps sinensis (strain Co18 / CGMCC 3.14243) TaxID=911162 RepID=T5AD90_OPHSC|nr:hypothetical protein OCS_03739 [Ophiocordyceps sinensis CO18]
MRIGSLYVVALGTAALASDAILSTLEKIQHATVDIKDTMARYQGGYANAVPIVTRAILAARSADANARVLDVARSLTKDVGDAVDASIEMKSKLSEIPAASRVALVALRQLHGASSRFVQAYGSRASVENREAARALGQTVESHLVRGIKAYEGASWSS